MINSDALRLIKEQAQMKEKENWAFYNFLKGNRLSDEEIDKKVWRLTQRFSKITNCTNVGIVAKFSMPHLQEMKLVYYNNTESWT